MRITRLPRLTLLLSMLILGTTIIPTQSLGQILQTADESTHELLITNSVDSTHIERRPVIRSLDSLTFEKVEVEFIGAAQGSGAGIMPMSVSGVGEGYLPDFSQSTPAPNASALIRAINNPINLATGSISMQAPLYTLDAGSIQIPVSLSYQSTGIQIGQKASNVGLGWRLSGIGQVTRVVKGFPDEQAGVSSRKSQGWCNGWPFTTEQSVYEWFAYDFWSTSSYYAGNGQLDNEPDIFYFEIPGKSGMFVFDHSGNALTIPYQSISINWVSRSYFRIIDEDGTIYTFGESTSARESTRIDFPNENIRNTEREVIDCTTTWFLNSVESLKGDKVTMTYMAGPAIEYTNFSRSYELKDVVSNTSFKETVKTKDGAVTVSSPKYLSKITAPTIEITFGINTRSTLAAYKGFSNQYTWMEIRKINVPTSTSYTKRLNLIYSTFYNGEPKLTRVDEVVGGVTQNLFSFAYYDENANFPKPHNFTTYIDFWGYWTSSASSSTLRPTINFFRTHWSKYTNFEFRPLTESMPDLYPMSFRSVYSDYYHLPHFSTTGYAMQTSDYIISSWYSPNNVDYYDYDSYYWDTAANQDGSPYTISGSNRNANLTCTRAYTLQKITYPTGGHVEYTYELNEHTHKGDTPRGPNNTYKAGGLRIKTVKQHDGKSATTTTYNYGQGVAIRDVRDEYFYTVTYRPTIIVSASPLTVKSGWNIDASSNALLSPNDLGGSHVIYPTVEAVNPDGSKTIHQFSSPETGAHLGDDRPMYAILQTQYSVALNGPAKLNEKSKNKNYARVKGWVPGFGYQYEKMNSRHYLRGLPISERVLDPSGNTVSRTDYTYLVGKPKGQVLAYKPARIYRCPALFVFQYISQPVLPKRVTVSAQKYSPNTTTEYTYTTTDYRPKEITQTVTGGGTTSSPYKNEVVTQRIKYSNEYGTPANYAGEAGGIKTLQERKAVVPIEVLTIKNDSVVAGEITSFRSLERPGYARTVVPHAKYSIITNVGIPKNSVSASTLYSYDSLLVKNVRYELMSRVEKYDNKANATYATSPFSNDKVYVYGYNGSLPIAEVEIPRDTPAMPYFADAGEEFMGNGQVEWSSNATWLWSPDGYPATLRFIFNNVQTLDMTVSFMNDMAETVFTENISRSGGVGQVDIPFMGNATIPIAYFEHTGTPINVNLPMDYEIYVVWDYAVGEKFNANYVFHTSFENSGEGTALAKAKTGIQAKSGTYTISLAGFNPGDYVLTYWKSTNSGTSWEKVTENLSLTSGMTSKTIGGSFYIDEVRLIPRGALIKTFTYRPDAGKISETDHNGNTRYWEYDNRGRVVKMLNNDRQTLETYEYHIKN